MKTVLVIGASGFLGSNIVMKLKEKHKVVAAFNKNIIQFPGVSHFIYNLGDRDYMKRLYTLVKPDIVIYAAGINDFVECVQKPRITEAINSFGPVVLAQAGDAVSHRFIHLSTSYVFDGKKGNYSEIDVVFPDTSLGKSKLAGENYVRSKAMNYTILRFPPIFGIGSLYRPSYFDRIRMKLERRERVELPTNETHNFLYIDKAIEAINWCILHEARNRTYHLGGLTKLSWYDFGIFIAKSFGFDPSLIIPIRSQFEGEADFSLNGSDLLRQLEVDSLILEQGLDLLKQKLIC